VTNVMEQGSTLSEETGVEINATIIWGVCFPCGSSVCVRELWCCILVFCVCLSVSGAKRLVKLNPDWTALILTWPVACWGLSSLPLSRARGSSREAIR